ncbi:hypothetical protein ACTL6U_16810 [Rhodovibrionaceae bacterium A322]
MSKQRLCRSCEAKLGIDDDVCPACGESNPVVVPWYTKAIGGAIVILIIFALVDFDDVMKVLGG